MIDSAQQAARSAAAYDRAVGEAPDYAFPHSAQDESRRLELLEQRLDPLTKQRIQRLGVGKGARCLEIGGGRGSITRWLSDVAGPAGRVIATDVQIGFLSEIGASNVESSGTTSVPARFRPALSISSMTAELTRAAMLALPS